MKLILPVAGKGTRLRPFTLHLPKCLLPVGGKTILDWIVESTSNLPISEKIFITGYKAECVEKHLTQKEWGKTRTILQNNPQGLGEAINLCMPHLKDDEPTLIILGDTLFKADLTKLASAKENILMTKTVSDPSRFGVAVTNDDGIITKLVEKPKEPISYQALVGLYYIKDVSALRKALEQLIKEDKRTKGEYQLTDALQIMIENGAQFRTQKIDKWLDCGLKETLLETNTEILPENNNAASQEHPGSEITPPCYIGKNVTLTNCKIGPNVAIGDNCKLDHVNIKNSIVWDNASLKDSTHHNDILADEVRAG